MRNALLQLDGLCFSKFHMDAATNSGDRKWTVTTKAEWLNHKQEPNRWALELHIKIAEGAPYKVDMVVFGLFRVEDAVDIKAPAIQRLVRVNGPTMLYSAAREMLAMMTGRGPNGAMLLPAVCFADEWEAPAEEKRPVIRTRDITPTVNTN